MRLTSILVLFLAAGGCSKKAEPIASKAGTNPPAPNAQEQTSEVMPISPGVTPASAPAHATVPESAVELVQPVAIPAGDWSAALASMTQGLRKYGVERQRVPASLSEVIAAGYITAMPQAPPGKKFAIDTKRMEVVLARQ